MASATKSLFRKPMTAKERWHNVRKVLIVTSPLLVLALVLLVYMAVSGGPTLLCSDLNCFVLNANSCKHVRYDDVSATGTIYYSAARDSATGNCTMTKRIDALSKDEDPAIVALLKGKSMECEYPMGKFNGQWTTSMMEGIEDCRGDLKDAVGVLLLLV